MKKLYILFILSLITNFVFAQLTYVPDNNFELALIDRGYDDILDDYVLTDNINSLTELFIGDEGITDLTGIEDFSALHVLICYYNYLTVLDVSQNSNLLELRCYHNQLANLILPENSNLEVLDCDDNHLASINVSTAFNLEELYVDDNELTSIDVFSNTELRKLGIAYNQIDVLDVSNNPDLWLLYASVNQISYLDFSNNTLLSHLLCNNNQLEHLNVKNGNNVNFTSFKVTNNPSLTCIQVDNEVWAEENWRDFVDPQVIFSNDCQTVYIPKLSSLSIEMFPNPFTTSTALSYELKQLSTVQFSVFNQLGQIVYLHTEEQAQGSQQLQWKAENKPDGLYYYRLQAGEQVANGKIVKVK